MAVEPSVWASQVFQKEFWCGGRKVGQGGIPQVARRDAVDSARVAMNARALVALAGVGPVQKVGSAVWALLEINPSEERIGGNERVGLVFRDVSRPGVLEGFHVGAFTVEVQRKHLGSERGRPLVALGDEETGVSVPAAEIVCRTVARLRPTLLRIEVEVVRVVIDLFVDVRVGIEEEGAREVGTGNHVPEVPVDGVDEEEVVQVVPIVAPGVGRAVTKHFESAGASVETPDASVEGNARCVGGAGSANAARARAAASPVEPAVRSEADSVCKVVMAVAGDGEAVENGLGFRVWLVVVVAVRDEEQFGRANGPDAVLRDFDSGQALKRVGEDGGLWCGGVRGMRGKHDDAVAELGFEAFGMLGVGEVFSDPEPSFVIPRGGDGVADVGLACKNGDVQTFWGAHACGGLFGAERFLLGLFGIERRREGGRGDAEKAEKEDGMAGAHGGRSMQDSCWFSERRARPERRAFSFFGTLMRLQVSG